MKSKTITFLAYGIPVLLVAAVMAFNIFRPILVLPRIGLGPGFGLSSIADKKITNETMRGKIVLYSFTYTHCDSGCDALMRKMQAVREQLKAKADLGDVEVELVTITIDPERDTPETLAEYAAQYGVTPQAENPAYVPWHFVTGADPALVQIMVSSGFDLYHEKVQEAGAAEDDYRLNFVPMAVLIDGWGIIRSEYRQFEGVERLSYSDSTSDIDPDIFIRDIELVAQEVINSKGAVSAAYEAAHLFSCYPP